MKYRVKIDDMCMKYHEYSTFTIIFGFPFLLLQFYKSFFPIRELFNFSKYGINIFPFVSIMSARE